MYSRFLFLTCVPANWEQITWPCLENIRCLMLLWKHAYQTVVTTPFYSQQMLINGIHHNLWPTFAAVFYIISPTLCMAWHNQHNHSFCLLIVYIRRLPWCHSFNLWHDFYCDVHAQASSILMSHVPEHCLTCEQLQSGLWLAVLLGVSGAVCYRMRLLGYRGSMREWHGLGMFRFSCSSHLPPVFNVMSLSAASLLYSLWKYNMWVSS